MRKYLISMAVFGLALLPTSTMAQSWSGPYVGAHGGFAWLDWDGELTTTAGPVGFADTSRTVDADGGYGGLQIGYNFQLPNRLVFGVEADISWGSLDGDDTFDTDPVVNGPTFSKKHDLSLERFGTARLRAGYNAGAFMPYITGGLAWGKTNGDLAVGYTPPNAVLLGTSNASANENHLGWTIGAGVEYALGSNFTIKAEYLHIDLGEEDYDFKGFVFNGAPFNTDSFPADLTVETVRVGINYNFN